MPATPNEPSRRAWAAKAIAANVIAFTALAVTAVQAKAQQVDPGGSLGVVHAAAVTGPMSVTVDGVADRNPLSFASAQPFAAATSGRHEVSVKSPEGSATASVDVGVGCAVTVLAFRPGGPGKPLALQPREECPVPEVEHGRASVRLLGASVSAGRLTVTAGTADAAADPGAASERILVPAGAASLTLTRAGSPAVWRRVNVTLVAGRAYDLLVAGDGDTPITTRLLEVADGPANPVAAGTIIGTDGPSAGAAGPSVWLVALAVVLAALAGASVVVVSAGLRPAGLAALAGLLLVAGAGCGPAAGSDRAAGADATPVTPAPVPGSPSASDSTRTSVPVTSNSPVRLVGPGVDAPVRPYRNDDLPYLATRLGPADVAWLDGMALPGSRGFAVLAGHVSWGSGPAVFGGLEDVPVGARFDVVAADGTATSWVVEGSVVFRKGVLPVWLSAPQAVPRLALITCQGLVVDGFHVNNLLVVAHQDPGR